MFTVYILRSITSGKIYIGQTNDLARRLAEHNNPEHNPRKYTSRNQGPWELIHSEEYPTRSEAMRRERWLKSGVGRAWIKREVVGRASPPLAD